MATILVVAPHPDDETLGCGGTLLRHRRDGDTVHWLIGTAMHQSVGYSDDRIKERESEIARVASAYGFASVSRLPFTTTRVDAVPVADLVSAVADVLGRVEADTVYVPFHGDAHSDHRRLTEATLAATKWFRAPALRLMLAYETLSETNFAIPSAPFHPNAYVDIGSFLESKIKMMQMYPTEIGPPPFPRSVEAVRALALLRGSEAGCAAAEAFSLIRMLRR